MKDFFDRECETLKMVPVWERAVRSLIGRERRFPRRPTAEMEPAFRERQQQIEADLIKTSMVRLDRIFHRRNMTAGIVTMIHDALWVETPEEEADEARHLMWKMMTTGAKLKVPLEVDIK